MESKSKVNILLVDDRAENLLALEACLESPSYNLVIAHSGEEALKQVLSRDFAIILLDAQMPGLDGFETAKLIKARQRSRHTPIIFMSAIHKAYQHVLDGYTAGAVDYLFTPYDPDVLRAKVAVFVEMFHRNDELKRQVDRQEDERRHRYRILADILPLILWTADTDGAVTYLNKPWFDRTARTFDKSKGWNWLDAVHPDDREKCRNRIDKAIQSGEGCDIECRIRDKEGKSRPYVIQIIPERSRAGQVVGWFGIAKEIDGPKEKGFKDHLKIAS